MFSSVLGVVPVSHEFPRAVQLVLVLLEPFVGVGEAPVHAVWRAGSDLAIAGTCRGPAPLGFSLVFSGFQASLGGRMRTCFGMSLDGCRGL